MKKDYVYVSWANIALPEYTPSHLEQHHPQLSDQSAMKHYCAKSSGFNDWRSDMVAENK